MKWLTKRVLKKVVLEAALPALLGRFPAERIVASLLVHLLREVPRGGMRGFKKDKWRRVAGRIREAAKVFHLAVVNATADDGGDVQAHLVLAEALEAWSRNKTTPLPYKKTYR